MLCVFFVKKLMILYWLFLVFLKIGVIICVFNCFGLIVLKYLLEVRFISILLFCVLIV